MARKKNFDPEQALIKAVELFWKQGYANTSINDLVEYLGVNRFSLYSTFGDKKELYLLALNYYIDHYSVAALDNLMKEPAQLQDLKKYFQDFSKLQYEQTSGCFVQNAILELSLTDRQVSEAGQRLYALMLDSFKHLLQSCITQKQVAAQIDVHKVSSFLLLQVQGIRVLGKAKQYDVMEAGVQSVLEYVDSLQINPVNSAIKT
jgi:AcrR family transcriptional regulator